MNDHKLYKSIQPDLSFSLGLLLQLQKDQVHHHYQPAKPPKPLATALCVLPPRLLQLWFAFAQLWLLREPPSKWIHEEGLEKGTDGRGRMGKKTMIRKMENNEIRFMSVSRS